MSTISGRKVRADAKLEQLNETHREWLHFWFEENYTYHEIVRLLHQHCGLSVGKSTVSAYYRRHVLSVQQEEESEVVAALAALPAADFDKATLQRVKALLWSAVARPQPEVDRAAKLSAIIDKVERRALTGRKLDLEERKVVVREKSVAVRAAAEERRSAKAGLRTTKETEVARESRESARIPRQDLEPRNTRKDTKGAEGSEESAEKRNELRTSKDGEGVVSEAEANAEKSSDSASAGENLPRYPRYSGVVRTEAETELGTTKGSEKMKDETLEMGKRGGAEAEKMKVENWEIGKHGAARESAEEVSDAELDTWSLIQRIRQRAERREQEIREMEEEIARDGK